MVVAPTTVILLALVAFVAGIVDAVAGGGGLLTVPALLAVGLPPHLALGTNKGVSTWGTGAAAITFAIKGKLDLARGAIGFAFGAIGAVAGARAQLAFPAEKLRPVVLGLLVVVAVVLAIPRRPRTDAHVPRSPRAKIAVASAIALVFGVYDGFFGPGTGTFIIVSHVVFLGAALGDATADAKAVNLGSNVASLTTFVLRGTVIAAIAFPMAVANVVGGILGARLAVRGGDRLVRYAVIAVSLALVVKLAIDLLRR